MNEIQRIYWGSAASPIPSSEIVGGTFTLTHDGQTTSAIDHDASEAEIVAALESLSTIGAGNVAVALTANGLAVEFQGALANTDQPAIVATATLIRTAPAVAINETQSGQASTPTTPSISTTRAAQSPMNEAQSISLGGATSGTFDLSCSGYGSATVNSLDQSGIQTALDAIFGSGNASVTSFSDPFAVEFQGSLAGLDVPEMSVTNNATDGVPSVSTTTNGQAGVTQQETVTFSNGAAVAGAWEFAGVTVAFDGVPSDGPGYTVTGTAAAGQVLVTWGDTASHTPPTVANTNLVSATGQAHAITIELEDTPTAGQWTARLNSGAPTSLAYNASTSDVATALASLCTDSTWSVTGANPWTATTQAAYADPGTITGATADPPNQLTRPATSTETVTTQSGRGATANTPGDGLNLGLGLGL